MEIKISVAIHIIGIVMWLGGLLVLTRIFKLFTSSNSFGQPLSGVMSRIFFGYIIPGTILTVCTGLYQLSYAGMAAYMSQGWFHGKLTLVLILLAVTAICFQSLRKARSGATLSRGMVGALHGLVGLTLLVGVFVTVLFGYYFAALGVQG